MSWASRRWIRHSCATRRRTKSTVRSDDQVPHRGVARGVVQRLGEAGDVLVVAVEPQRGSRRFGYRCEGSRFASVAPMRSPFSALVKPSRGPPIARQLIQPGLGRLVDGAEDAVRAPWRYLGIRPSG